MKALDYLNKILASNKVYGDSPRSLIEAIYELEELESRSCESCKYYNLSPIDLPCSKCSINFDTYWEKRDDD